MNTALYIGFTIGGILAILWAWGLCLAAHRGDEEMMRQLGREEDKE